MTEQPNEIFFRNQIDVDHSSIIQRIIQQKTLLILFERIKIESNFTVEKSLSLMRNGKDFSVFFC